VTVDYVKNKYPSIFLGEMEAIVFSNIFRNTRSFENRISLKYSSVLAGEYSVM